jgi:hypothetical protein
MASVDDCFRPVEADGLLRNGQRPLNAQKFDANGPCLDPSARPLNSDPNRKGGSDGADGPGSGGHCAGKMGFIR